MKKLFTLIAAVLFAVCANAGVYTLWEGEIETTGWSGQGILSDAGLELADAGAAAGDVLRFYVTVTGEEGQLQIVEGHWDKEADGTTIVTYGTYNIGEYDFSKGYVELELTEAILTRALTKSWWGNSFILNGGDEASFTCTKVELVAAVTWAESATNITFDENGFIAASAFEGLNDRSKVVFNYEVTGTLGSKAGWGIGSVGSNDDSDDGPSVKVVELPATVEGANSVSVTIADIKKALAATPEGIHFKVWDFDKGAITATRTSVQIYAATVDTAEELWTLCGATALFGSSWKQDDEANDMTLEDGVYTLVVEGVTLEKGVNYEYKVAKDHAWGESYGKDGGSENAILTVDETGIYTVTFTFDAETKTLTATAVKTGDAEVGEKTYSVVGTITDGWDDDVEMEKQDDGTYKAVIEDVAAGTYEFKIRVDASWDENYGPEEADQSEGVGVQDGKNLVIKVEEAGSTITITFDPETKMIIAKVTNADGISTVKVIDANGAIYNVAGQKVSNSYKGLVIKNGKKYIQK